jgi:allose kinase
MTAPGAFAGVDLGGTHTRCCLYQDGAFVASDKAATGAVIGRERPVEHLSDWIGERIAAHGVRPQALAIGIPGPLDKARRIILSCPNQRLLDGCDIVAGLSAGLGMKVLAERDVNFQFYHDLHASGRRCHVALGFYLGTGFGNAVWIDGLYNGAHGSAAELGHIPAHGATEPCGCGLNGCVETVCSGRWLAAWRQRHAPETPIEALFLHHAGHPDIREFLAIAAETMATAINLFDPELVFLGGGVIDSAGFPLDGLKQAVLGHTRRPLPHDALEIRLASNLSDSGARGACLYAAHQFKE